MEYLEILNKEIEELREELVPWFGKAIRIEKYTDSFYITKGHHHIIKITTGGLDNQWGGIYQDEDFEAKDVFEKIGKNLQEIKVKNKQFRKNMLTNGDLLQCRNGELYIYLENTKGFDDSLVDLFLNLKSASYSLVEDYDDSLSNLHTDGLDIIKICSNYYVGYNLKGYKDKKIKWTWIREEK